MLSLTTAVKAGRAMELSSPVASLVPGLVDNAVVTFGDRLYRSAAIPFRRVPAFASWAVVCGKERTRWPEKEKGVERRTVRLCR